MLENCTAISSSLIIELHREQRDLVIVTRTLKRLDETVASFDRASILPGSILIEVKVTIEGEIIEEKEEESQGCLLSIVFSRSTLVRWRNQ